MRGGGGIPSKENVETEEIRRLALYATSEHTRASEEYTGKRPDPAVC